MKTARVFLVAIFGVAWAAAQVNAANLVANPSFENNQASFVNFPGYISGNAAIDSWNGLANDRVGINGNSGSGYPFADNGVIPNGVAVAFVQSNGAASTLSQTVNGLSIGSFYQIQARINSRAFGGQLPNIEISMGGNTLLANQQVTPVGGGNDYRYVTFYHQAAATSENLVFQNSTGVDTTLVVDAVSVDPVFNTGWLPSAWSNDATSGIDAANPYSYSHAYNLGSGASPNINGVTFQGVGGGNPSVPGKFTVAGMPNTISGFVNNVTDPGSNAMASTFIYGGNPGSITLEGLVPGVQYVATFYGVSYGGGSGRAADFSINGDRITVDENALPGGDGVKLQYSYTADNTGSATLNVQPYLAGSTIHFHGFANQDLTVTGLFNSGVDANRVPLANGAIDPHWSITSGPIAGNAIAVTAGNSAPIPPWLGDNSASAWIAPTVDTNGPEGNYVYQTTFNAAAGGLYLQIQGNMASDNDVIDILLNGVSVATPSGVGFGGFTPFDITGLSVAGVNTLAFVVSNFAPSNNPTGFRVEFTSALAVVPEPSSLALLTFGLLILGLFRRKPNR